MGNKLTGWRSAAKYVGGMSAMAIRRLVVDKQELPAVKGPNGWEFDTDDLDRLRDRLGNANVPSVATAPQSVAPPVVAAAITYPAEPEPAPRQAPVAAPWLLRAEAGAPEADYAPARAQSAPAHEPLGTDAEPPYWETQGIAGPASRAEVEALRTQVAQLQQALVQERQQHAEQVASLQQQIDHATAAWARAQASAIAGMVAVESLHGAAQARQLAPEVIVLTQQLRDAAYMAVAQLQPRQLREEQYALAVARHAAHMASMQIAAQIESERRGRRVRRNEIDVSEIDVSPEEHERYRRIAERIRERSPEEQARFRDWLERMRKPQN